MKMKQILNAINVYRGFYKQENCISEVLTYIEFMKDVNITNEEEVRKYFEQHERDWEIAKLKDYSFILNSGYKHDIYQNEGQLNSSNLYIVGKIYMPTTEFREGEPVILDVVLFSKKTFNIYYVSSKYNLVGRR